jgi:hypothetical protein
MKPTERQMDVLRQYLHGVLTYRESYDEIYDHILTALEFQSVRIPFQDAVNNIIHADFGGAANLVKAEKSIKEALVNEAIQKYFTYFKSYFMFPRLLHTVTGSLLSYCFFVSAGFSPGVILAIFALIILAPSVIWLMRLYNTGYLLDTTRKSAKDKLFETFTGIPIRLVVIPIAIAKIKDFNDYKIWQVNNYYLIALLFVIGLIYNLTLYKLYKDEFKTALAK